jgi:hypothetical protein
MSGPQPKNLDTWLRRACRNGAVKLVCTPDDGPARTVQVKNKGARGPNLIVALRAVESLSPVKVEGLDAEGALLDTWEAPDPDAETTPGYAKDDADTPEERMLKTFAHLLADAHKTSARQLVEVVGIQSRTFQEERRHMAAQLAATERLARIRAGVPRVRVSEGTEDEAPEEGDDFMTTVVGPLMQGYLQRQVATPAAAPKTNGAAGEKPSD